MAYIRPAKKDELVAWLRNWGLDDSTEIDVEALAEALIAKFDVVGEFVGL